MGEAPDQIRRDIEQTREQMGETVGALGYKTVRGLVTPAAFAEDAPFLPGSALVRAHERVAELLLSKVKVVQLATVLSNDLWPPALSAVLQGSTATLTRPLQMWNALPTPVRHRAARR